MKKEDIQFRLDQLRKDKILFATEIVATNIFGLFVFVFSNQYLEGNIKEVVNLVTFAASVIYSLYLTSKSLGKLMQLNKLEAKLRN